MLDVKNEIQFPASDEILASEEVRLQSVLSHSQSFFNFKTMRGYDKDNPLLLLRSSDHRSQTSCTQTDKQ